MTIHERAQAVKRELETSTNPQERELLKKQYDRLVNYMLTGRWGG